ncbi:MAG: flagellar biosynthetic protein FliR [Lachnospiraceae bacterium]|nr:flagellar biosynthetic protein FliR [Lachnospiraceae bacterium]
MTDITFNLVYFEYFLLILVRIATFMFVAPFFNQQGIPAMSKIGVASIVSILVLYTLHPTEEVYTSAIGFGVLIVKEALVGLIMGYAAYLASTIIVFAGNLIDMEIGFSMVTEFDPSQRMQVTITGSIYNYFMLMMLVTLNFHQYLIRAIVDSFQLIPLGGAVLDRELLLSSVTLAMVNYFIVAFRIMLPVFATLMIINCVLGIMAKVAPQMNMFAVGIQIKLLAGLAVLLLVSFLFPEVVDFIVTEMKHNIINLTEGLYDHGV